MLFPIISIDGVDFKGGLSTSQNIMTPRKGFR